MLNVMKMDKYLLVATIILIGTFSTAFIYNNIIKHEAVCQKYVRISYVDKCNDLCRITVGGKKYYVEPPVAIGDKFCLQWN